MKIAILNDTHCGARGNSDIFINYQERFYSEIFFPYLKKHNIKHIIHAGDYYENRKFINFKALNANRKHFLEPMKALGITMDIVPGNHDVYYKNTNDLCALKELLGYYTSTVNIVMDPKDLDFGGVKIALLPWVNNSNYSDSLEFIKRSKASVLIGHLELAGFEMMKGITNPHGMNAKLFSKFNLTLSGHFHTKSNQGNVHYLGSQMEFNWNDCDDQKYFHILDTDDLSLEAIPNPITLHAKIHYDDTAYDYSNLDLSQYKEKFIKMFTVKKTDSKMFDDFVDRLIKVGAYEVKISDSLDEFSGAQVSDDSIIHNNTSDILTSYVDAAVTDLNKAKLKTKLLSLYNEAQHMEII